MVSTVIKVNGEPRYPKDDIRREKRNGKIVME
jgi:hypothetical protein